MRFVNLAPGVAAANVTVDGAAVGGSLSFEGATAYSDVASGTRSIGFGGTTSIVVFGSEEQSTVAIFATGGAVGYLNLREGRMDKNNGVPGAASVRGINIAEGSAEDLVFFSDSVTSPEFVEVSYLNAERYRAITPGSRQFIAVSRANYDANLDGSQEVPPVTSLSSGVGIFLFGGDLALEYNIVVQLSSSHGLFLFAHFHQGDSVTNGPVVHTIDVSGQEISFPDASLSGDNEPTPVTTSASGTGTFTLTEEGLAFEVTVVADTLDTVFTAAHFHNAAAGANGPVVRTIATGVPFGDATFTGTWSSSDSEPLTPALVSELLAGNIYVNFHTASNPGGEIRDQVIPDALTENTFTGTWSDAALDTLRDALNDGGIYVNFHSIANPNPSGEIRDQVILAGGSAGVASLPAFNYEDGRMYTILATGAGSALQLTQLTDRQHGLSKPASGNPQLRAKAEAEQTDKTVQK